MKHIIVQAGGLGSRMEDLTSAKPKTLIPVDGKPILFHLLDLYSDAAFYVITDHLSDVLIKYTRKFRTSSNVVFVKSSGKGTCAGLREAVSLIPPGDSFLVTWSDLVFHQAQPLVKFEASEILIGVTNPTCSFECRWGISEQQLVQVSNKDKGVAGLFFVRDKDCVSDLPSSGSFVKYIKQKKWDIFPIQGIVDVGTRAAFNRLQKNSRYFNEVIVGEEVVQKRALFPEYETLVEDEIAWYEFAAQQNVPGLPQLLTKVPYTMSKIRGRNPVDTTPTKDLFSSLLQQIRDIHSIGKQPANRNDLYKVYLEKTLKRVEAVIDLIPFASQATIQINEKECQNPFAHQQILTETVEKTLVDHCENFCLIHGDCTFSNTLVAESGCFLIDPRGRFGETSFFGDPRYDWAKFYYSFYGNYDSINRKNYNVQTNSNAAYFSIKGNGWEKFKQQFFDSIPYSEKEIELLHVLIWFSLCGYVVEDYSSILVAFYKGVELWNSYKLKYLK